jgi:hypothetical protein
LNAHDDPVRRAGLLKRPEQIGDRGLDLLVRIDHDLRVLVVEEADREREAQLAALGRGALGALHPGGDDVQFGLGHLRLQAEDQPVVEVMQVIDPVGVDDQRVGQPAELKQPVVLRVVAPQPRDLQAEDRADFPQAHPPDHLLVTLAQVRVAAGDAQIAVDDHDPLALPTQPRGLVREPVLALGRTRIEPHLRGR